MSAVSQCRSIETIALTDVHYKGQSFPFSSFFIAPPGPSGTSFSALLMLSGLLSSVKQRFHTFDSTSMQEAKILSPTPQWANAVLVNEQLPATEHTSLVPDDVYDDDDNRSIDSSSDCDSLLSVDMDVVEEDSSDATSASACASGTGMVVSAKPKNLYNIDPVASQTTPQLTTERLKEFQGWQDFVRAIQNPHTTSGGVQRYVIFSDNYMWAQSWKEMETVRGTRA